MARIMFAWELGANYGHIARLLPIAGLLRSRGNDAIFVVRETRSAGDLLSSAGFEFVQAPYTSYAVRGGRPLNYAEMLLAEDYGNRAALMGQLRAWLTQIKLFQPDVMVVDHSPTAMIAARVHGLPVVQVGTGFAIPPNVTPLPSIRVWESVETTRLQQADDHVTKCINDCIRQLQPKATLESLNELFVTSSIFLSTFRELDHYPNRVGDNYVGPFFGSAIAKPYSWQSLPLPKIFAYLRNGSTGLPALIETLQGCKAQVVCVIPGLSAAAVRKYSSGNFKVLSEPVAMESILPEADLAICHAGSGVVAESLLTGVPLLMIPTTVDQYLQGRRVVELQAGILVGNQRDTEYFKTTIASILGETGFADNARKFAERHRGFDSAKVIHRMGEAITMAAGGQRIH